MSAHVISWSPSVYPRYENYKRRLTTFPERFWPVSLNQDHVKMAKAGFFYSGFGDIVVCAFCGVCLNKWHPNGDPITEHKKFNSDCKFVRLFLDDNRNNHNTKKVCLNSIKTCINTSIFYVRAKFYYLKSIVWSYFCEQILKTFINTWMNNFCKICLDEESNILILPCRHVSTCSLCTLCIKICPICRCEIASTIKIFFS